MTGIERLARVVQESPAWQAVFGGGGDKTAHTLVLAILDALAEPSEGMVAAGQKALLGPDCDVVETPWQAMLQHIRNGGA
jgi:hypothetical protein